MAINFPNSPSDGQIFYDTDSGNRYIYSTSKGRWSVASNNSPFTATSNNQVLFNNQNSIDGDNGLVFDVGANTLYANSINVAYDMRVRGNLYIGSNTVTISNNSIAAQAIYVTDNTGNQILVASASDNPSFNAANIAYNATNSAFSVINAAFGHSNATYASVNSAFGLTNAAFGQSNNEVTRLSSAYVVANSSYAQVNTVFGVANAAFNTANSVSIAPVYNLTNASFDKANSAVVNAAAAYAAVNTLATSANAYAASVGTSTNNYTLATYSTLTQFGSVFGVANAAFAVSNAAFAAANSKVATVSGTSGRITSSGSTGITLDLATTGPGAGSYSSGISALTLDAYGRVTAVTGSAGYVVSGGALGTPSSGTLTNCTFPTLNQNTTGSAGSVTGLTLNSSANGINPDNVTQNQLGYCGVSLYGQGDGALFSSAHSSNWVHQIYGDFRTGQIAIRGKNNGTWQSWYYVPSYGYNNASYSGALYPTIVYDSNNTGYYVDPNSSSKISGLITFDTAYGSSKLQDAMGFVINGNYTAGHYSHRFRKWDDGNGVPLYVQSTSATPGTWSNIAKFGPGGIAGETGSFTVYGFGEATGSWRAPIFYDSDDTAYYCNPAGSSRFSGIERVGGSGNWDTDFQNTPAGTIRYGGDFNAGTNGPTGGTGWWVQENFRHSNASSYWGVQVAWGWEDRANELYTRNVTGGGYGSWIRYWNSANAPGTILQVQQTHWNGVATLAAGSFTNHPNLSVAITPRSTSSKILVMVSMQAVVYNLTMQARFTRNDTPIGIATAAGSRILSTFGGLQTIGDGNHQFTPWNYQFLDSPGTTSALTYRIQLKMQSSTTAYLNRSVNDADNNDWAQRTTSSITVMEIAS